jgi:hypothetical protein
MLQEYATTVCKVQHAVYSTNISLHVSMTSKKLFASTMDNKNSSILGIQIVCKAAPKITRVRIQNRKCEQSDPERTLDRVFPTPAEFSPCHPSHVIPCLNSARTIQNLFQSPWRRRTDDKADYFVILKRGQLKGQLCIFKSFPYIQPVEVNRPIRATLAP